MEELMEIIKHCSAQLGHALLTIEEAVFLAGVLVGVLVMCLLVWAICAVTANMHIFQKAGEGGWKSFVPIYNNYITYKISWRPLWFWISALLFVASVVLNYLAHNKVLDIIAIVIAVVSALIHMAGLYRLSKAFGHGVPFTLGLIFLHPVFILILGLGSSEYQFGVRNGPCGPTQGAAAHLE